MSKTADVNLWDSSSDYHKLRANDAKPQVEQFIMPFLQSYRGDVEEQTICDFACGGGSIALEVAKQSVALNFDISRFLFVDAVKENIAATKMRAGLVIDPKRLDSFLCNGKDFSNFRGKKCSLLYCWDAMVHFDIIDIVNYLASLHKICSGYCLFHHSNYGQLTADIRNNPHWRNFMTQDVFRQICISSNHTVISQKLLSWGVEDLDCITIVKVG